jgi:hypothetical protein
MVRLKRSEKRHLFYNGITDIRGNVRLDRLNDAQEYLKRKEEKIREGYNQILLAKNASGLLGIKIGECYIVAIFGLDVYIKCFDALKRIDYSLVIDYIKNSRIIERV